MRTMFAKNDLFDVKDFGVMSESEIDDYMAEKKSRFDSYVGVRIWIGALLGLLFGEICVVLWGIYGLEFTVLGVMLGGWFARDFFDHTRDKEMLRLRIYRRERLDELANADLKDNLIEVQGQSDSGRCLRV